MFVLLSATYTVEYVVLANTSALAIAISSADTILPTQFYLNFLSSDDNLTESCKIITLDQ